jgi:sugar lactone lactonase YvrE
MGLLTAQPMFAQVPAVVAHSPNFLDSIPYGNAVVDACGDMYVYEQGYPDDLVEIQPSGKVIVVLNNTQGYSPTAALYMDEKKQNLYVTDVTNYYTTHFDQIPITNCVPGAPVQFATNLGSIGNYYYGTVATVSGDAAGDVFFTTTSNNPAQIYEEALASGAYTVSTVLTWTANISYMAVDASGDIFFSDNTSSTNLYELSPPYATNKPVAVTLPIALSSLAGISFDPAGNMYLADYGNSQIYEIPLVANASNVPTLTPADEFVVANVTVDDAVAVDNLGNIYLSNTAKNGASGTYGAYILQADSVLAPSVAVGTTSAVPPINFIFNTATTPTSISAVSGTKPSTDFVLSTGTGACVAGTTYQPGTTCSVSGNFTPSSLGVQTGGILFTTASSNITFDVSGTGLGTLATADPGTITTITNTLKAPAAAAFDNLGNLYVADSSTNMIYEFGPGGTGGGTAISTGTLTLKSPQGIAIDSLGDIFIADTGNNRVVEIPVVGGVLTNANTVALSPALKAPQGVAVDANNNLYIADTGDNNILYVPNVNGAPDFSATKNFGSRLNGPAAIALDPKGDLFIAETGGSDILELAAPVGTSQVTLEVALDNPTALATDAAGNLYEVDNGSGQVYLYPAVSGGLGEGEVVLPNIGDTIANPTGIAVDRSGNLFVTDSTDNILAEIGRSTSLLNFGTVNQGETVSNMATVTNSGNQSITFATPSYTASGNLTAGFAVTTDECGGKTLAPGGSCEITASFSPTTAETNATETLTLNGNTGSSTQIQLVGSTSNLTVSSLTVALTNPPNPLTAGAPVTLTATVGTGSGTASPGGTVTFYAGTDALGNPNEVGFKPVVKGAATLTVVTGLPKGSVTIFAVYSGDSTNYTPSTSPAITAVVGPAIDSISLALVTSFSNPNSGLQTSATATTGPTVQLTAVLTPAVKIIPNGTVTFDAVNNQTELVTTLGSVPIAANAAGVYTASLTSNALTTNANGIVEENGSLATSYTVFAVYGSDGSYADSQSNNQAITVSAPPVTLPPCAMTTPGPQTCEQNASGAFIAVAPLNPTIVAATTTTPGQQSSSTTLTIYPYGGWAGIVTFSCTGLPAYATCAPFPGTSVVASGTAAAPVTPTPVTFNINTNVQPIVATGSFGMLWWVSGTLGFVLLLMRRRLQRAGYLRPGKLLLLLGSVLLLAGSSAGLSGCTHGTTVSTVITPAGTSTVQVTVHAAQYSYDVDVNNNTQCGGNNCPSGYALDDPNEITFNLTLIVK